MALMAAIQVEQKLAWHLIYAEPHRSHCGQILKFAPFGVVRRRYLTCLRYLLFVCASVRLCVWRTSVIPRGKVLPEAL